MPPPQKKKLIMKRGGEGVFIFTNPTLASSPNSLYSRKLSA